MIKEDTLWSLWLFSLRDVLTVYLFVSRKLRHCRNSSMGSGPGHPGHASKLSCCLGTPQRSPKPGVWSLLYWVWVRMAARFDCHRALV